MDNHWFEAAAHHMGDSIPELLLYKGSEQEVAFPHQRTQPETRDEIARCGVRTWSPFTSIRQSRYHCSRG